MQNKMIQKCRNTSEYMNKRQYLLADDIFKRGALSETWRTAMKLRRALRYELASNLKLWKNKDVKKGSRELPSFGFLSR